MIKALYFLLRFWRILNLMTIWSCTSGCGTANRIAFEMCASDQDSSGRLSKASTISCGQIVLTNDGHFASKRSSAYLMVSSKSCTSSDFLRSEKTCWHPLKTVNRSVNTCTCKSEDRTDLSLEWTSF